MRHFPTSFHLGHLPTRRLVMVLATMLVLLVAGALTVQRQSSERGGQDARLPVIETTASAPRPARQSATNEPDAEVSADLAQLRAVQVPVQPTGVGAEPLVPSTAQQQPDLYARAFVQRLLTQNYSAPRVRHLAWVQAESARTDEPLVTGLIPPKLRDRLALFSVTDERSGPAPVPSREEWGTLAQWNAHTTVEVQRVSEPLAWSNAVEAGRVSDPGVTAREVTATVTLHSGTQGHARTSLTSVALTLNLVGPPTRDRWMFVAVITYRAVALGPIP
jgi:hypothetical protein